jgi:holin-like protein
LSLLFIPAGVGIMVHGKTVLDEWIPLVIALVLSTAISIVVTALCVKWMSR